MRLRALVLCCTLSACGRPLPLVETADDVPGVLDALIADAGSDDAGCSIERVRRVKEVFDVQPGGAPYGLCATTARDMPASGPIQLETKRAEACDARHSGALFDCLNHAAMEIERRRVASKPLSETQLWLDACEARHPSPQNSSCLGGCDAASARCERGCRNTNTSWNPCIACTDECTQTALACMERCPVSR